MVLVKKVLPIALLTCAVMNLFNELFFLIILSMIL